MSLHSQWEFFKHNWVLVLLNPTPLFSFFPAYYFDQWAKKKVQAIKDKKKADRIKKHLRNNLSAPTHGWGQESNTTLGLYYRYIAGTVLEKHGWTAEDLGEWLEDRGFIKQVKLKAYVKDVLTPDVPHYYERTNKKIVKEEIIAMITYERDHDQLMPTKES